VRSSWQPGWLRFPASGIAAPAFNIDVPAWEPDPGFDIHNHVRQETLPRGTDGEFKALAAKILGATMDRGRPLWDFTLVNGLRGNRTGMVVRFHHCLTDGVSAVGLLNAMLDPDPLATPLPPQPPPAPAPSVRDGRTPLIEGLLGWISALQRVVNAESEILNLAKQIVAAAEKVSRENTPRDGSSAAGASEPSFEALKQLLPEVATAAERLPFNVVCRGPQELAWTDLSMAEIEAVKQACGVTVNDVVLTVVTLATRRYARLHGVPLRRRQLRIAIPVNVRPAAGSPPRAALARGGVGNTAELGNCFSFLPVNIPLDVAAPRALLCAVHKAVDRARSARLTELVSLLGTLLAAIPTPVQAVLGPILSQLPLSLCNLICTNVPGPPAPLYLLGHKLLACYPYVPIGGEMGMNCAVLSYDGKAYLGLTGDVHAIPDLGRLPKLLRASFTDLRQAAGLSSPSARRTPPKPAGESPAPPTGDSTTATTSEEGTSAPDRDKAFRAGAGERSGKRVIE
jgi:diacylglycerol O-acyltransferase